MGLSFKLCIGPMGAGKTTEGKRDASRRRIGGYTVLWFRAEASKREGEAPTKVVTHDGDILADVSPIMIERGHEAEIERICMGQIDRLGHESRVLAVVDEVHFLGTDIVAILFRLALIGVEVECLGLDADFLGRPFPTIRLLREIPEVMTVLVKAVCPACGEPHATRTLKLIDGIPAGEESPSLQAGNIETGTYTPRCYSCYMKMYSDHGMGDLPYPRHGSTAQGIP